MECNKCNLEMKKVNFCTGALGSEAFVSHKKKGILEIEKRSTVSCYICVKCGHIEFIADNPDVFKNI